jgi:ribosome maturation protein SDO1
MAEKLNLARIKKFGENFEISVNPDLALKFKQGEIRDVRECLLSEQIYSDANKALVIPSAKLQEVFKTDDPLRVAEIIIKEGEIQLTSDHRAKEREQKLNKLIHMISKQAVDPQSGLPHPPARIEAALEEGKIRLDENKSVEAQFDDIVAKLRPIIPISIEQKVLNVVIPASFVGKANGLIRGNSKILGEDWRSDGSWSVKVEIPAGFQEEFIDKLNSITSGQVVVEVMES